MRLWRLSRNWAERSKAVTSLLTFAPTFLEVPGLPRLSITIGLALVGNSGNQAGVAGPAVTRRVADSITSRRLWRKSVTGHGCQIQRQFHPRRYLHGNPRKGHAFAKWHFKGGNGTIRFGRPLAPAVMDPPTVRRGSRRSAGNSWNFFRSMRTTTSVGSTKGPIVSPPGGGEHLLAKEVCSSFGRSTKKCTTGLLM